MPRLQSLQGDYSRLVRLPVAENLDDRFRRREPEWPVVLAPIAPGHDRRVLLGYNSLRMPTEKRFCRYAASLAGSPDMLVGLQLVRWLIQVDYRFTHWRCSHG